MKIRRLLNRFYFNRNQRRSLTKFWAVGLVSAAIGGAGFMAPAAVAQTVWQGGASGNWNVAGNWTAGVPNSAANVIIDGDNGNNATVLVNIFGQANNITIDTGDTLQINNGQRLSIFGDLFNDGLLQVGAVASNTYFQPVGTTTFWGNGVVELLSPTAWLYDNNNSNAAPDHLINSANHTIRGVGNIGFSTTLQITNQGLIDANVSGQTLTVSPNSFGMVNTGVLRASNGGNLNLNGSNLGSAVIDNTGGVITAEAGSTVTHNTGSRGVLGGQLTGAGTHVIGSSWARFNSLTVDAQVDVLNGHRLDLLGTIVNNNLIKVSAAASNTYLQTVGTTTLAGNGVVELAGPTAWLYDNNNSNSAPDHLINTATHTIRGAGNIGFSTTLQITNQGLIDADVAGETLNVAPNGSGMINTGLMRASNGGTLNLNGGSLSSSVIDNTGGIIEAGAGSKVTHNTGARGVLGGLLTGAGTHEIGSSWARFNSLTVDAHVDVLNGHRLDLLGTIINNNLIEVSSLASNTYLQTVGTTTLAGNGVVQLAGPTAWMYDNNNSNAAPDHLINTATHTIRGAGNIGFSTTLQITNQGLIDANVSSGVLNVSPNNAGLLNTGVLRASNGGTLNLSGSNHGGSGTFEALNGSQLLFDASTVANNVTAGGVLTAGTWRAIDSGGGATLRIRNNATALINTIGTNASVELSGVNSLFTVRAANITLDSTLNDVQGSLALRDGRAMMLSGNLSNSGTILLDGAATSLSVSGDFNQSGGSLLLDQGSLNLLGSTNLATAGLIAGNGTINGDFTFGGSAIVDPGFSPGQLNFGNDLTWSAGGSILFDLGVDSLSSDFIDVAGQLLKSGSGSFAFTFVDNGWVDGQTYDLIGFNSTDFSLSDFSFTNGGSFNGSFAFSGGNLLQFTVNAVPEPHAAGLLLATAGLIWLNRRKR